MRAAPGNPEATGRTRSHQFTLAEVLAMLLVLGVLSAVVVSRGLGSGPALQVEETHLRSNLRFVQALAMADTGAVWSVVFSSDGYSLYRDGSLAGNSWPGEETATHALNGVRITASPGIVTYSSLGSVGDADQEVALADRDDHTAVITIVGGTGFVR